jgi:hypothetical protein
LLSSSSSSAFSSGHSAPAMAAGLASSRGRRPWEAEAAHPRHSTAPGAATVAVLLHPGWHRPREATIAHPRHSLASTARRPAFGQGRTGERQAGFYRFFCPRWPRFCGADAPLLHEGWGGHRACVGLQWLATSEHQP